MGAAHAIQDRGDGQNPPSLVRIGHLASWQAYFSAYGLNT
jgi:hypothetical protein